MKYNSSHFVTKYLKYSACQIFPVPKLSSTCRLLPKCFNCLSTCGSVQPFVLVYDITSLVSAPSIFGIALVTAMFHLRIVTYPTHLNWKDSINTRAESRLGMKKVKQWTLLIQISSTKLPWYLIAIKLLYYSNFAKVIILFHIHLP